MINRSKGIKFFLTAAILAAVSAIYIFGGLSLVYSDQWKTDWSKYSIDRNEFMRGGPPKDGIPSIDRPPVYKAGRSRIVVGGPGTGNQPHH